MRRETDPTQILHRLLDRFERRSDDRRRIIERPSQSFPTPELLARLVEELRAAERSGSVTLKFDKDAPHLVAQVVLVDPEKLYDFLRRDTQGTLIEEASQHLDGLVVATPVAQMLREDFLEAWRRGRKFLGHASADVEGAIALIRSAEAIFTDLKENVPMRTRSARLLGDSKALERAIAPLTGYLKHAGVLASHLTRNEAIAQLGLSKYPQPVLVAGPLLVDEADISSWPYAGIPAELVERIVLAEPIRTLLTIENLESFHRHVRTCRMPGDIVVYTGGFPAPSVLAALHQLASHVPTLHHWGDIDPGGIRIGRFLETAVDVPISLHLMSPELAEQEGQPRPRDGEPPELPKQSAFWTLADYLFESNAKWLEQEVVDPKVVASSLTA